MDIQPSEISAILKREIRNFDAEAEVSEVGQVLSVGDGIARVYGLDNVQAGEMVPDLRQLCRHAAVVHGAADARDHPADKRLVHSGGHRHGTPGGVGQPLLQLRQPFL